MQSVSPVSAVLESPSQKLPGPFPEIPVGQFPGGLGVCISKEPKGEDEGAEQRPTLGKLFVLKASLS